MSKLGLYIHVPFCRQKCRYCDFYSLSAEHSFDAYGKQIARFLSLYGEQLSHRTVDTVYLGGGTPSLLPPAVIETIFCALRDSFPLDPDAEITAEGNPESLTEETLAAFRDAGVNRLSVGMQSADDGELSLLGRLHSAADVKKAVLLARRMGFHNLSLDLMYALPDQREEAFISSVQTALSYEPEHLSFYCLTLSEDVPLHALKDRLPSDETQRAMYLGAVALAEKAGLAQYEISNAARPGCASRHNLRYWRGEEYLGLGPGAWSYLDGERFSMAASLDRFLSAQDSRSLIGEREKVDVAGKIEEEIVLSLRLTEGLNGDRLAALAGEKRAEEVLSRLADLEEKGLTAKTETGYRLTPSGFFVSNRILTDLI